MLVCYVIALRLIAAALFGSFRGLCCIIPNSMSWEQKQDATAKQKGPAREKEAKPESEAKGKDKRPARKAKKTADEGA